MSHPIPEPSAWAMLLIWFAGIGFVKLSTQGRRKSSQDQPCFLTHHSDFLGLIAWGASVTELRHG